MYNMHIGNTVSRLSTLQEVRIDHALIRKLVADGPRHAVEISVNASLDLLSADEPIQPIAQAVRVFANRDEFAHGS
jgi:hypothetical protein